ncbi:MAG: HD domain-containing phosphohydrolase [Planctomycetota bacterium]
MSEQQPYRSSKDPSASSIFRMQKEFANLKEFADLTAILDISKAMMAEKDVNRLLNMIVQKSIEVLNADRGTIFLMDYDTLELSSRVGSLGEVSEIRFPADKGIAGYVAQKAEVANIKDAYTDKRFNPEIDKKTGYRTKSILCAPLLNHKNEVVGVLQLLNKKDGVFTNYDESLILAFSAQAAVAVENAQLYYEQELTFKSLLKTMAATIDAKDPTTAGHSERVARYALNMGQALGFNDTELRALDYAATLHDVGKISVPDAVLLKPGKLTPEEFIQMKHHASKTKEILDNIFFSREIREIPHIASTHHEKLDGTGYPLGLRAEQISKAARILAIADVYDALVAQDRPYKKAMTHEQALVILEEDKGLKFDAEILDLFRNKKLYLIERRQASRLKIITQIQYAIHTEKKKLDEQKFNSETVNISATGLLITSDRILAVGSMIEISIPLKEWLFNLAGKIVRVERKFATKNYLIGIAFINLEGSKKHKFRFILHNITQLLNS